MFTRKDSHQHTLRKAFKKTRIRDESWYFLMYVCTKCPFTETYDLVQDKPLNREKL